MKILVVDDEINITKVLHSVLSNFYTVDVAHDGVQALEMTTYTDYDVIVTDITMPQMRGDEFAKKFREENKTTFIIFVTGLAEQDVLGLSELPNVYIMFKPLDLQILINLLEEKKKCL